MILNRPVGMLDWPGLRGAGFWWFVVEEAGQFGVVHHHVGIGVDGGEVFFLKGVAGFGGRKHFASNGDRGAGEVRVERLLAGERFIDAHDEFRDAVEPRELRMVNHQAEKLADGNGAVLPLILLPLHFEECFVNAQECVAKRHKFFS
jgi:hypothetical protein